VELGFVSSTFFLTTCPQLITKLLLKSSELNNKQNERQRIASMQRRTDYSRKGLGSWLRRKRSGDERRRRNRGRRRRNRRGGLRKPRKTEGVGKG
jgi:hypothetical protein